SGRRLDHAPRRLGAAGTDGIWLWPVEAHRHARFRYPGRDPEVRAGSQDAGDRPDVRTAGARTHRDDGTADRLASDRRWTYLRTHEIEKQYLGCGVSASLPNRRCV